MPLRTTPSDLPIHEIKAELFKALGHPLRVRVLELLIPGERAVSDLLEATGLEASHLSQHLAVLRRTGLVVARREGNAVHYRHAHPGVADLLTAARTVLLSTLAGTRDALADLEENPLPAASAQR
ncbi:metalloregulator ArsR/SmtB family transcription factor [Actinotalea sp. K2]|uniref:ArsR/SmtB family transcription factor n=1 Tax=Actinotalea sp. K2 TaxID=2939438 RepID=UPI002017E445|nr:metalloregulator ArsR/SmtB family transcription factor [Actinotalea sp. K2]MCL3861930.1 metalloregulator ArsR/SmtB family transcription factor [Actinotalea sp. K2]